MNYILDKSEQSYGENLTLFTAPDVNTAIESVYQQQFNSIGKISRGSVIEFDISNNSADYLSLADTEIDVDIQIEDNAGATIGATDDVGLINLMAMTIFRQIDIFLGQQNLSSSVGHNFPYKAILDTLLNSDELDQITWLKYYGFDKDYALFMDKYEPDNSPNGGLKDRYGLTQAGKIARLSSRLFVDICNQQRLLVNNVPINFKFYPSNDRFSLMYKIENKTYHVKIINLVLRTTFVRLNKSFLKEQSREISGSPALYPFSRSDIKTFSLAGGTGDWSLDNIFQENIPDELIICLVDSDSYNGHPQKNPFNFKHHKLSLVEFAINGVSNEIHSFRPSYEWTTTDPTTKRVTIHGHDDYATAYLALFENSIKKMSKVPNITDIDFKNGYNIYKFDLSKRRLAQMDSPMRKGQTRLSLKFSTTLDNAVTVIAYGRFKSLLKVSENRNITVQV